MTEPEKEEAIPLVTVKDDGTLGITIEAINFLNTLQEQKIAVLTMTGPINSGKSHLLNSFLHNPTAFGASTKGLYIWKKAITLDNGIKLLLIDSQGLSKNAPESSGQKLFILSILLSTCLIYNTSSSINEDTLSNLAYYTDVVNKINIKPENINNCNNIDNLSEYFPEFIWILRDTSSSNASSSSNNNKDCSDLLEEQLIVNPKGEKIRKLFKKRSCYYIPSASVSASKTESEHNNSNNNSNNEFIKTVDEFYMNVKKTITNKKINKFELDGNALFGMLQNYLDLMNHDENPVISLALENVLLSKANNISEKNFESFKTNLAKTFEPKYPMNMNEIYKTFFELQNKETELFCADVQETLTIKQCGDYLNKLHNRMRSELEFIFETNKEYYDEWFDMEYKELEQVLASQSVIDKIDDLKTFFTVYTTTLQTAMNKMLDIPNYEPSINIIGVTCKIIRELIAGKIQKFGEVISEKHMNYVKEREQKIEDMKYDIKRLNEQVNSDKKIIETKNQENSELKRNLIELETKFEKINLESKVKEKEAANNLLMEVKKSQQLQEFYLLQLKEKDNTIVKCQQTIDKLNKNILDINKENSNKANELHKENLKLHSEIERMSEQAKKGKSEMSSNQNLNLQSMFKSIQNTFTEFEESLSKLDIEAQNIFKMKYLEQSTNEIKNKFPNWIEALREFGENQIKTVNETNEKKLKELQEELQSIKWESDKKDFNLKEKTDSINVYKMKLDAVNQELKDTKDIANAKNELISIQNETVNLLEKRIAALEKDKTDLEMNLNKNIVNYKMKEDEIETLVIVFRGILSKRKDKYDHNIKRLSGEPKKAIEDLVRQYKLFK